TSCTRWRTAGAMRRRSSSLEQFASVSSQTGSERPAVLAEHVPAAAARGLVEVLRDGVRVRAPDQDRDRGALDGAPDDLVDDRPTKSELAISGMRAEGLDLDGLRARIEPADAVRREGPIGGGHDRHHVALEVRHRGHDVVELAAVRRW